MVDGLVHGVIPVQGRSTAEDAHAEISMLILIVNKTPLSAFVSWQSNNDSN